MVLSIAPGAGSTDVCIDALGAAIACVQEGEWTIGDDCAAEGARERSTSVEARASGVDVDVVGYRWCSASGGYVDDQDGVAVQAATPAGYAEAGWVRYGWSRGGERTDACTTWVYTGSTGLIDAGCPAGAPPDVAWGELLP